MAIPKFYLEKRKDKDGNVPILDVPILMFYSYGSGRLQYYTGQRVDAKHYLYEYWKERKKPIKSSAPSSANINNALELLASDVVSIHHKAKANGIAPSNDYFRTELDKIHKPKNEKANTADFIEYFEHVMAGREDGTRTIKKGVRKGQRYRRGSTKNARMVLNSVKGFTKNRRLPFERIDMDFYRKYRKHIFDSDKELSTFALHIQVIKSVMNESITDGINAFRGHEHPEFIKPSYESDTISVAPDLLEKVEQKDFTRRPYLDRVRDSFLVECYSALRFSDFSNLAVEDIKDNFIRIKQIKTGERVTIPVMKKMKSLIDKYNGSLPPAISNQKFNEYIKEVFEAAGLTHEIPVISNSGGVESTEMIAYNKMVSSHTGRRTYATNMFRAGVPVILIMAVTGHKTEAAFLKYIRATNEDKARMMAEMMEKLGL